MKLRHLASWFSGAALLGMGATLLFAQAPQPPREGAARIDRARLRKEIIKLRTEVEMLRLDYEFAHEGLSDELKVARGLKLAEGMFGAFPVVSGPRPRPGAEAPRQEAEQDRKKSAEEAKAAELAEKAVEAAISEEKKKLGQIFALLSEKRLDLEDAEQSYREAAH